METLCTAHHIAAIDVVIANAGISTKWPSVIDVKGSDIQEHILINAIGPVLLFQAVLPLLVKSTNPRFVAISSSAASIGDMGKRNFANAAYGSSKATLNYLVNKMHFEHPNLTVFPIDPGYVLRLSMYFSVTYANAM